MTERSDGPRAPRGGTVAAGTSPEPQDNATATAAVPPGPARDSHSPASAAAAAKSGPPPKAPRLGPSPRLALWFVLPALIILGALVIYPIIYSLYRSFFDATGQTFVGVQNYGTIFTNPGTLTTIRNNLIWVVVAPILVTTLGLIFAVLTERIKWATAFKLIVFMPMAVSLMASGVIFRLVYEQDPDKGMANAVLTSVRDVFDSGQGYPGIHPRDNDATLAEQNGAVVTRQPVQPGTPVSLPLVGVRPDALPADVAPAKAPAAGGALGGTVWLDFALGGGGTSGQVDGNEKGLPGITVEAVQNGEVKGTTTTTADGAFTFAGLPAGDYTVRLPQSNFEAPFNGISWLGPALITPAIIGAFIWVWAGFAMVLIAAGLASIPRDALEAARMDGATEWQVFRKITVPLLSPVLVVVFVTMIINTLKVFDLVFVIAPGSVQSQANVIALEMWRVSFGGGGNEGLGSALAIFLLILVLPFMIINVRRFRREQQS
ncbi:ABC transporter permease [Microtetraspora sp. NBRC 13810]|uniref:ABC transporter permease n=1 Tax=Microtetraspora sp. NBRC 13810 TaxID=3030990 RepID=UPI0024A1A689|nr:ABC transporter permease subunit [Microtetraspora sp. NBRC 13810]GLW05143.1 ABC transporter permease [Microtetraspora sp. NBRC 13810]